MAVINEILRLSRCRNMNDNFVKIRNYDFRINHTLIMNLIVIWKVPLKESLNASNQNSNMPFLRNDFSKTLEDLFYKEVTNRDDSYWSSNWELKIKIRTWKFQSGIEINDILKLHELETCDSVGVQLFWLRNRLYGLIDF